MSKHTEKSSPTFLQGLLLGALLCAMGLGAGYLIWGTSKDSLPAPTQPPEEAAPPGPQTAELPPPTNNTPNEPRLIVIEPTGPPPPRSTPSAELTLERDGDELTVTNRVKETRLRRTASPKLKPSKTPHNTYFKRSDAILATSKFWTNDHGMASGLVNASLTGNSQAFEPLIDSLNRAKLRHHNLQPPAGCSDCKRHHKLTQEVLDEGLVLVKDMKHALEAKDVETMTMLSSNAQDLMKRAEEADDIAEGYR